MKSLLFIGVAAAQTCNETLALYQSVCCGNQPSTLFAEPGSILVKGTFAAPVARRRLSAYQYELADASMYEVTFLKASLCTGTTNNGSYGPPIVCENELIVGSGLTESYNLANPNVQVQLRNLPVNTDDTSLYNFVMVEMDRVVRISGKSTSCCTTATMPPDDVSKRYGHFRYASSSTDDCLQPNATDSPFFTDGVLDICQNAKCTAVGSTGMAIVKDPPASVGGSIAGIEKLVDNQPTMKVIVKTAQPVLQSTSLVLTWYLQNSISFELFDGVNCNVGPYFLTVIIE